MQYWLFITEITENTVLPIYGIIERNVAQFDVETVPSFKLAVHSVPDRGQVALASLKILEYSVVVLLVHCSTPGCLAAQFENHGHKHRY